jgi:hypothetical protein
MIVFHNKKNMTEPILCELCHFMARDKTDYTRHLSTKKHTQLLKINKPMNTENTYNKKEDKHNKKEENPLKYKYYCMYCVYGTVNKYNYEKHLQSIKHKNNIKIELLQEGLCLNEKEKTIYEIDNDKTMYEKSEKKENVEERKNQKDSSSIPISSIETKVPSHSSSVIELLLENQKLQKQLIEKDNLLETMMLEQKEDIKKIIDKISDLKIKNYHTNHITYHQNTNIQFFLTEKCKDAINLTDFLNSLVYSFESLEYVGRHGYVNGITKLIADRLNTMGINERPIHCMDLKREVLYIKEDNRWEKDTPEIGKMKKMVNHIGDRNMKLISKWQTEHPEIEKIDTPACDFYFQMIRESSNSGKKGEQNNMKIISNICEMVYISQDDFLSIQ